MAASWSFEGGKLTVVVEYRVAAAVGAVAVVAAAAGWILLTSALVGLALAAAAARFLPARLGLGEDARVALAVDTAEVALVLVLRDVRLGAGAVGLPLPLALRALAASEFGAALKLRTGTLELRSRGLHIEVHVLEPVDWDQVAAGVAAEAAVQALVTTNFQALEAAGAADKEPPESGKVSRLVDAVVSRIALLTEDFALAIELDHGVSPTSAELAPGLRARLAVLELPPATSAGPRDAFAPRWNRRLVARGFALEIQPAGADTKVEPLLPEIAESVLSFTAPPVLCGLLSGRSAPSRRIDVDISVGQHLQLNVDEKRACLLWALLSRYSGASKWQQDLRDVVLRARKELSISEREVVVESLRKSKKPLPMPGLSGEDQLALRSWAAHGESLLGFDPRADGGGSADEWRRGAARLWARAEEAKGEVAARAAPLYHELGVRLRLASVDVAIGGTGSGAGEASVRSRGLELWLQLLPTATELGVVVATGVGIDARPPAPPGSLAEVAAPAPLMTLICGGALRQLIGAVPLAAELHEPAGLEALAEPTVAAATVTSEGLPQARQSNTFSAALSLPTDGPKSIELSASNCTCRVLPKPMLGSLLPGLSSLLECDPVPDAPQIDSVTSAGAAAAESEGAAASGDADVVGQDAPAACAAEKFGLLGGRPLVLNLAIQDSGLVLPSHAYSEDLAEGVAANAMQVTINLASSRAQENVKLQAEGIAVVVPGPFDVLLAEGRTDFEYSLQWCAQPGGTLTRVAATCPFSQISVSPAVLSVSKRVEKVLTDDLKAMGYLGSNSSAADATPGPASQALAEDSAQQERHARVLRRLRKRFQEVDDDGSGKLDRPEVEKLVQSLCTGMNSLTKTELDESFEDLWAAMDVSNDGEVSFSEFCHAIERIGGHCSDDEAESAGGCRGQGTLVLSAGELCCAEVVRRIQGSEEALWAHLKTEVCLSPDLCEGAPDPHELQWKLFRALRHFDASLHYWDTVVAPRVAPGVEWMIGGETEFLPAHEVLAAAFAGHFTRMESGDNAQTVASTSKPPPVYRGFDVAIGIAGFRLGLADALAILCGRGDRLVLEAGAVLAAVSAPGAEEDSSCASPHSMAPAPDAQADGPAVRVTCQCWRQVVADESSDLAEADKLEASVRLRGFRGSCLSPFGRDRNVFIKAWGMEARASSREHDRVVTVQLLSDEHFVVNVSSALLLAMKPVMNTLLPAHDPSVRTQGIVESGFCTTPLDQLLLVMGRMTKQDIVDHGLCHQSLGGALEIGVATPGEEEVDGFLMTDKCEFQREIPRHLAISRIALPVGWAVHSVLRASSRLSLRLMPMDGVPGASVRAGLRVSVFARDRKVRISPTLTSEEDASGNDEETDSPQRSLSRRALQAQRLLGRRELQVVNRCGVDAQITFECTRNQPWGMRAMNTSTKTQQLPHGRDVVCTVPRGYSGLCLQFSGWSGDLRLGTNSVGRFAVPLTKRPTEGSGLARLAISSSGAEVCLGAALSISVKGYARLEFLAPLELRNATQQMLRVQLVPPPASSGDQVDSTLAPGETLQVPLPALDELGWAVISSGAVTHAFLLNASVIGIGQKEAATRRMLGLALERHMLPSATSSGSSARSRSQSFSTPQLRRHSLLLLPGLRVLNALPVALKVELTRLEDESAAESSDGARQYLPCETEVKPGVAADFNAAPQGFRLRLTMVSDDGTSCSVEVKVEAEVMQDRRKFAKFTQPLNLGDLRCELQCSWARSSGPELVIFGSYVVFNKTGLPLSIRNEAADCQALHSAVPGLLRAAAEKHVVKVKIDKVSKAADGVASAAAELPHREGPLYIQHECQNQEDIVEWRVVTGALVNGALTLNGEAAECLVRLKLSQNTSCAAVEVYRAGGQEHAFRITDPSFGCAPLLRAETAKALKEWLQSINSTASSLRNSLSSNVMSIGWDSKEQGACSLAPVPEIGTDAWSQDIPVQAADAGEVVIESETQGHTIRVFLGVQVRPLVGLLARSTGITFTPRFVVQNRSEAFVQVMPAMLPLDQNKWQVACEAGEQIDQLAHAIWVPPKESIALFHFPLWCTTRKASSGCKAIALRLAGCSQLELNDLKAKQNLYMEPVAANFMPYRDAFCQLGPLPTELRALAQEGRLRCLRGLMHRQPAFGEMSLNMEADVVVAVPEGSTTPTWLISRPWAEMQSVGNHRPVTLDLCNRGQIVSRLSLFHGRAEAGPIWFKGLPDGSFILLSQPVLCAQSFGHRASTGLPWSRWVSLDKTGDDVHELNAQAEHGQSCRMHFLRSSVQVESSTAFLVLSSEQAPYRVENRSPSRTLALMFPGSSSQCRVLPPLSWCAFNWPNPTVETRQFIVHDVSSSKRQIYNADAVGPGKPLDLKEVEVQAKGETAPLTEEGYQSILLLLSSEEMIEFVRRVAEDSGGRFRDREALADFARKYSGESRSLRKMRQELIARKVVPLPKPVLSEEGCRAAMLCEETMSDFVHMLLAAGDLTTSDSLALRSFVVQHLSQATLQGMIKEVATAAWVQGEHPVDISYELAAGRQDVVGIQLCMWRALRSSKAIDKADGRAVAAEARSIAQDLQAGRRHAWKVVVARAMACDGTARGSAAGPPEQGDSSVPSTPAARGEAMAAADDASPAAAAPRPGEPSQGPGGAIEETGDEDEDGGSSAGSLDMGREETSRMLAGAEPLTEEGYLNVARLRSPAAMEVFIRRIIEEDGGEVIQPTRLPAFASWYSGKRSVLSLARLREDVAAQDWVRFGMASSVKLYMDRWHDGVTKVCSFSEGRRGQMERRDAKQASSSSSGKLPLEWWDIDVQLAGLHVCFSFEPQAHALGTGVDPSFFAREEELFTITADHLQVLKMLGKRKVEVRLHHFQIDNLREADRVHPIILAPLDSGYHSDRYEQPLGQKRDHHRKATSFIYFVLEQVPSNILHIRKLEYIMQSVTVRLDLVFWIEVGKVLLDWFPQGTTSSGEDAAITEKYVSELRCGPLVVPTSSSSGRLMLLEFLRIGAVISHFEFLMPLKSQLSFSRSKTGVEAADITDDDDVQFGTMSARSLWLSSFLSRVSFRSQGLFRVVINTLQSSVVWVMQTIGTGVISGAGHVTPKFSFPETWLNNEFGDMNVILANLTRSYVKSGLKQWWRVFLSTNLLGDPIGLGTSVTGGLVQFVRKTGSEMYSGDIKGEGIALLAQGVVGGAFGHAGKLLGALGDTFEALAQTGVDDELEVGSITHVGDGVAAGLRVFANGTVSGFRGVVERPMEGFQRDGVAGLGKGLLKGFAGLAARPVAGLLHGAQHIAEGVDATTHLLGHSQRIKPRREPAPGHYLQGLNCALLSPNITIFVEGIETDGSQLGGATYCVKFTAVKSTGADDERETPWSKTTRLGHLVHNGVLFQEAKWCPSRYLLGCDLEIEVQDHALSQDPCFPTTVYTAKLPDASRAGEPQPGEPQPMLEHVADLLRNPSIDERLHRIRPATCARIPLTPLGAPCTGGQAGLLLKFWPAWDPETVPYTQRWIEPRARAASVASSAAAAHVRAAPAATAGAAGAAAEEAAAAGAPPRKEGFLEKRSRGAFHHWSKKWVVLIDHELRYWNEKRRYAEGKEPKSLYRLADPNCPFRFAAGDKEDCFLQMQASGQLEAQWRPEATSTAASGGSAAATREWLQAILLHSIDPHRSMS